MRSRIRGPTTGGIPRLHDIVKECSDANDWSSQSHGHCQSEVMATTNVECAALSRGAARLALF